MTKKPESISVSASQILGSAIPAGEIRGEYEFFNQEAKRPEKRLRKAWKKSAQMRKAPVTLATTPFDHKGGE